MPKVRAGWQRLRALKTEVNALFHEFPFPRGDTPSPLPTAELPRIRGYEVREVLGRGGMGIVFKAWHLRLQRPVAVKMLLACAYAQPQELERFLPRRRRWPAASHYGTKSASFSLGSGVRGERTTYPPHPGGSAAM